MRAVFYYPSSPSLLPAHCIPCFVNQIARPRVQSCFHVDRFEISVILKEVRQVAQKAVIKRFLWKRHFSSVLQNFNKLFWGALGGKAAIPASCCGMCLHQTTEITVIWHPFIAGAALPALLERPAVVVVSVTGLYLHREERALGKGAPGASGDTPGLESHPACGGGKSSRGRDKWEHCVWGSTSANLWNHIEQFLAYLHLQNGCKNEWILFCQVLVNMETIEKYVWNSARCEFK